MAKKNKIKPDNEISLKYERLNLSLFSMLLIATPFLMIRQSLQSSVHLFSNMKLDLEFAGLPYVMIIAAAALTGGIIFFRKRIKIAHLPPIGAVLILMYIAQNTADFYLDFSFYDLQNNWHYIAYGLFTFVSYRYYGKKKLELAGIIIKTYFSAMLISAFDEGVQVLISNRIFDISDIAKDLWGTVLGLIILVFIVRKDEIKPAMWKLRQANIKSYLKNPLSALFLLLIFSFMLLSVSSLLTSIEYWHMIILISLAMFSGFFFIFHLTQKKAFKTAFSIFAALLIAVQAYFFVKYRDEGVIYAGNQLIIYKGLPLAYFDVMIFPDGGFRFVDKKLSFKKTDFIRFYKQKADILLLGGGAEGEGGKGILSSPIVERPQFVYNPYTHKGMQAASFKNSEAVRIYNKLLKKGYKTLFVIHNS